MVSPNKERVMISLSKSNLIKLDAMCKEYGMTRSDVLQMLLVIHNFHIDERK